MYETHSELFSIEQEYPPKRLQTTLKSEFLRTGITLATAKHVKQPITHRAILVAIGILVAVVIAFTLWIRKPDGVVIGLRTKPQTSLPITVRKMFSTTFQVVSTTFSARE